jgi:hypothetical protein
MPFVALGQRGSRVGDFKRRRAGGGSAEFTSAEGRGACCPHQEGRPARARSSGATARSCAESAGRRRHTPNRRTREGGIVLDLERRQRRARARSVLGQWSARHRGAVARRRSGGVRRGSATRLGLLAAEPGDAGTHAAESDPSASRRKRAQAAPALRAFRSGAVRSTVERCAGRSHRPRNAGDRWAILGRRQGGARAQRKDPSSSANRRRSGKELSFRR